MLEAMSPVTRRMLEPHLRPIRVTRGSILVHPGVHVRHIWFPHDCVLSVMMMLECGACAESCTIGREGMMGFVSSLGDGRAAGYGVVRIGGLATRVERDKFIAAFDACADWRRQCLRYTGLFIAQVLQSVVCNAHHSVESRLARQLLILHDRLGRAILPLTHEYLAEMLGTNRTTVTLGTQALQAQGVILQQRGSILVHDRGRLETIACECYRVVSHQFDRLTPSKGVGDRASPTTSRPSVVAPTEQIELPR
jgi:CRP-like cAMP-binding protein